MYVIHDLWVLERGDGGGGGGGNQDIFTVSSRFYFKRIPCNPIFGFARGAVDVVVVGKVLSERKKERNVFI